MVTFIDLNTTNKDRETVNAVKKAFDYVFRYTNKVNVHVIFNFKSPINIVAITNMSSSLISLMKRATFLGHKIPILIFTT